MYKILLADNEGVVLDSLIHMIYGKLGESCDIRVAKTARYTRTLARKFVPDIAVINIQMPGMHGFDVVREIRSYHIKCVFISVSSYKRSSFRAEAESLHILAHLTKPLFRENLMPVFENAVSIVSRLQKADEQNQRIQKNLDQAIPLLEHGLISQLFFPESASKNVIRYKTFLNIPQNYGRLVTLTFGENPALTGDFAGEDDLQNPIGSAVRLQRDYKKFRDILLEHFPLALAGPVMGNHILFLLPLWKEEETAAEKREFSDSLRRALEALSEAFEGLTFYASKSPVRLLAELHLTLKKS